MADCKHEWIGDAEGVECALCHLRLSPEEYKEYLSGNFKPIHLEKKKPAKRKTEK